MKVVLKFTDIVELQILGNITMPIYDDYFCVMSHTRVKITSPAPIT